MTSNVEVVVLGNDTWYETLALSCRRRGVPVCLCKEYSDLIAHLRSRPVNVLIIVVDAGCTVLLQDANEIVRRFDQITGHCRLTKVVIGVPKRHFLHWASASSLTSAGAYIGCGIQLIKLLERPRSYFPTVSETGHSVIVDVTGLLIWNEMRIIHREDNPLKSLNVKYIPCVLRTKPQNMNAICKNLGLPINASYHRLYILNVLDSHNSETVIFMIFAFLFFVIPVIIFIIHDNMYFIQGTKKK